MNTRGRKVRVALVFLLFIQLVGYSGIEAKEKPAETALKKANISAEKLVKKMERRTRKIRDLKAEIVCTFPPRKVEAKLELEFKKPGNMRIEGEYYWVWKGLVETLSLIGPEERIILFGLTKEAHRSPSLEWNMFWFFPGNFWELALMPKRTLDYAKSYRVIGRTTINKRKAYVLEIEPGPEMWGMKLPQLEEMRYLLYVDAKRFCPLRLSLKRGAWGGVDITMGNFMKLPGGFYLPRELQSGGGVAGAKTLFRLSRLEVNKGIPDDRFEAVIPDHFVVRDWPLQEREEYEKKLEENPEDINLLSGLAFVLKQENEFEEAARALEKAARIDPEAPAVKVELVEVLDDAGNWEEAVKVAEAASQQWPEIADFSENLAELYAKLDRPDDSLSALAKIRGSRRYGWLGRNVASILERQERYETAEKILKELMTEEGIEDTWRLRAVEKLVRLGDERESLGKLKTWWQEQLKEEPQNRFFKKGLADTFLKLNEKEKALPVYADLEEEAADNVPFMISLADTLNRERMYKKSEKIYSSLSKKDLSERQRWEIEEGLASIYMRTDREDKAIAHYKGEVVNRERNWWERKRAWGSLKSYSRKDPASLKAWVEEKIQEDPDEAIYQFGMAEILESEKEYEKAIPYYLKSLETPSAMGWKVYSSLAECYRKAGDHEKAIETYNEMLEMDFSWGFVRKDLAETYAEMGDKEKAREAIEAYLAHGRKDAHTFSGAGQFCQELGDYKKAEELLKKAIEYAYKSRKAEYRLELAELYKEMGKDKLAEAEAKKALEGKPKKWIRRRAKRLLERKEAEITQKANLQERDYDAAVKVPQPLGLWKVKEYGCGGSPYTAKKLKTDKKRSYPVSLTWPCIQGAGRYVVQIKGVRGSRPPLSFESRKNSLSLGKDDIAPGRYEWSVSVYDDQDKFMGDIEVIEPAEIFAIEDPEPLPGNGKKVLLDLNHSAGHIRGWGSYNHSQYVLKELLEQSGFEVVVNERDLLTPERLASMDLLVCNYYWAGWPEFRPYLQSELEAVQEFVEKGGSLLVVGCDRSDRGGNMIRAGNELIGEFGLRFEMPEEPGGKATASAGQEIVSLSEPVRVQMPVIVRGENAETLLEIDGQPIAKSKQVGEGRVVVAGVGMSFLDCYLGDFSRGEPLHLIMFYDFVKYLTGIDGRDHRKKDFVEPGKININTAGVEELIKLRGCGPRKARMIIEEREERGLFKSIEEITRVRGVGLKSLALWKDKITVGEAGEAAAGRRVTPERVQAPAEGEYERKIGEIVNRLYAAEEEAYSAVGLTQEQILAIRKCKDSQAGFPNQFKASPAIQKARRSASKELSYLGPEAVPDLLAYEVECYRYQGVFVDAIVGIGKPAAPKLLIALSDDSPEVRDRAARALGKVGGSEAVEPLIACLEDTNRGVVRSAIKSLGDLGDGRAVEPLLKLWVVGDRKLRNSIARSLGKIGDRRAVPYLTQALQEWLSHARKSGEWERGGGAWFYIRALEAIGDHRSIPVLKEALSAGQQKTKTGIRYAVADTAAEALRSFGFKVEGDELEGGYRIVE